MRVSTFSTPPVINVIGHQHNTENWLYTSIVVETLLDKLLRSNQNIFLT